MQSRQNVLQDPITPRDDARNARQANEFFMHIGINAQLLSLSESYRAAGVSNYIDYLLRSLSRVDTRNRYEVFTGSWGRQANARTLLPLGPNFRLRSSLIPTHVPTLRLLWEQTLLALRARNVEVLHGPVNVVPLFARPPRVVTIHDLSFLVLPEKHLPAKRDYQTLMTRLSVTRVERIITDSEYIRQGVIRLLNVAPEKIVTVPLGAGDEYHWFGDSERARQEIAAFRAKKGLPDRFFLYLGTLEPRKNIPMLLQAYAALHSEGMGKQGGGEPPALVVAGPKGWLYDEIFAQVKALGLEDRVLFPGFIPRDEVVWWYNAALAFVYLSVHEGFGLPPLQAMACGVPVVVNNASALPEVVGDAGVLVDASECGAVANALREVAADGDLRADLRTRGLERAAHFSWERTATQTLAVYESVCRR